MSVTILEALQNAEINMAIPMPIAQKLAKEQLHNAVTLLDKGYTLETEVEPLLGEYGDIENVPDIN